MFFSFQCSINSSICVEFLACKKSFSCVKQAKGFTHMWYSTDPYKWGLWVFNFSSLITRLSFSLIIGEDISNFPKFINKTVESLWSKYPKPNLSVIYQGRTLHQDNRDRIGIASKILISIMLQHIKHSFWNLNNYIWIFKNVQRFIMNIFFNVLYSLYLLPTERNTWYKEGTMITFGFNLVAFIALYSVTAIWSLWLWETFFW